MISVTRAGASFILASIFLLPTQQVFASAAFGEYKKTEFSPHRHEQFDVPVALNESGKVKVTLYTVDGDLVRTLSNDKMLKKGSHKLIWDGKDNKGQVVPDEVYIPVLEVVFESGKQHVFDPRESSGGEVVEDLNTQVTPDRHISYVLPAPSRVMVRAGIQGGPMMRSLSQWQPRSAGKNVQRWNGMDESGVLDLREEENLTVMVTAYRLPEHSIITLGNGDISYGDYRKKNGWPPRVIEPESMTLARGEQRISRQHYVSPAQARDPVIKLSFSGDHQKNDKGNPVLKRGQSIRAKVEVDEKDRWLIDQSLYEVAFFINHEFVSEEEQGYLPLTWLWTTDQLTPGQHIFTVNISGFDGKVGVVSSLIEIEE